VHARVGWLACNHASWGKHDVFAPSGISAMVSMAKGRVPVPNCNAELQSESDTTEDILKNVEWGWRGQTPTAVGEPDPGRGNFLSPRSAGN